MGLKWESVGDTLKVLVDERDEPSKVEKFICALLIALLIILGIIGPIFWSVYYGT